MSPRLRFRKDVWAASAVLGNTEAQAYVVAAEEAEVSEAAEAAAEAVMSIRKSLVGEEGAVVVVWFWMVEASHLAIYQPRLVRRSFDMAYQ
jgi:hypothetical protein